MVNPVAYQPGLIYHNNTWKTANQMVAESNMMAGMRPLTDQFPVSTGLHHKTSGVEEEDVGGARVVGGGASTGGGGNVFNQQVGVFLGVACFFPSHLFTVMCILRHQAVREISTKDSLK